mgnify:CR=1 FL=1
MRLGDYHSRGGSVIRIGWIFIEIGFDSRVQHHYGDRTRRNGKSGAPAPNFLPVHEASTVAKPELGTKRVCPETGRKFYDLNKDPIVSPYTGKEYPISYFEETAKVAIIEKVKEEEEEVVDSLRSGWITSGPKTKKFEDMVKEYIGCKHAVALNSCTGALHLSMLGLGIGPGDEVITVPHTFIASASAIHYTGAKVVFCDIDPVSFTMDPQALEAAITPNTKAIVPVHLYGQLADMDPIMAIAKKHGLIVMEDAAQSHGAEYKGRRAGSIGDIAGFSFYPGKNMGATGEGGMTVTNDPEIDRKVRMLRDWGAEKKYHHEIIGYNMRMEGIQGAVLRVKLKYIEKWTEMRRAAAARYAEMFAGTDVQIPAELEDRRHVYHVYAIRTPDRERWMKVLGEKGIATGIHYPFPLHTLKAFDFLGYKQGQFPHAEKAAAEVMSLPMYPELTGDMQQVVADAVIELQNETVAVAAE